MALKDSLRSERHFDGFILLEAMIKCNNFVVENSEVSIVVPDEVSS